MQHVYLEGQYVYGDDIYVDPYYSDEKWAYIEGCPGYMVSNKARVWSERSQCFLKIKPMDDHGHLGVCLYVNGRRVYRYIHRLVAEAFIENPYNYPVVRHVYDNPDYNEEDGLAWGTQKDNIHDTIRNGRAYRMTDEDRRKGNIDRMTGVIAIDIRSGKKLLFESQGEASRVLRVPQANIWKVLRGQRSRAGGYRFEYATEVCDENN